MKTVLLVLAVVAAVAAAGFAWQRHQALEETRVALAGAKTELQKAQSDLKALNVEVVAMRKETAEQKLAIEQLRIEVNTAKVFLDAERASSISIREELTKTREALILMGRQRTTQVAPAPPQLVRRQMPFVIRAAPSGTAAGAAAPAR